MTINDDTMPTGLSANVEISKICGQRDFAVKKMREAIGLMKVAHMYATEAAQAAAEASGGKEFHRYDRKHHEEYKRIFCALDGEKSLASFIAATDASIWMRILEDGGIRRLMDAQAWEEFMVQLETDPGPVNEGNIEETLRGLQVDSRLIFQRGLANAFIQLDRRFKSHDAFKVGSRMILTHVFDSYSGSMAYGRTRQMLVDVERVFAILDKQDPNGLGLAATIEKERQGGWGRRQSVHESRYMRIRGYQNGNAHLWFTRPDLVEKVNLELADYYGQVLPDGVAKDDPLPKSGLPAKNLSFYATPKPVVSTLLREGLHLSRERAIRILEPSAGTGNIVHGILEIIEERQRHDRLYSRSDKVLSPQIDAIEIESSRVAVLRRIRGINVIEGNFLQMTPRPVYDLVFANPPFSGTHWMEHVIHAHAFLAPAGVMRVILPVTVEFGESKRHVEFRKWASKYVQSYGRDSGIHYEDLPSESFESSGTRVQTCILTLCAGARR